MKRVVLAIVGALSLAACGGVNNGRELAPNEGGALIIVEMPVGGTDDTSIVGLNVLVTDVTGQQSLLNLQFGSDELNLAAGRWPNATSTCTAFLAQDADGDGVFELNPGMADAPNDFLPANSSCISFTLVHAFNVQDQNDDEFIASMQIAAVNAANQPRAQIIQTIRMQRNLFLGDPANATSFNDVAPFVATLEVSP